MRTLRLGKLLLSAVVEYEPLSHPTFEALISLGSGTHWPGRWLFGVQATTGALGNPSVVLYLGYFEIEAYLDRDDSYRDAVLEKP